MSTHKKITKTIEVSSGLKYRQFNDGSFEIFFRGSPGGYYFVFSAEHKLLHRVHKSAYGIGKPETNEVNNWNSLKDSLHKENKRKKLPGILRKFLVWKFEHQHKSKYLEERLGCITYFREVE